MVKAMALRKQLEMLKFQQMPNFQHLRAIINAIISICWIGNCIANKNAKLKRTIFMTTELEQPAAYGGQMAKYFRLGAAPSLVIRPPSKPQIAITRLASPKGLPEQTASIPSEKAFVVSVHLTPACERGCELWVDDRYSRIAEWPAGGVGIYDLEADPRVRNRGPVDWVHYHVPRPTLDVFADDVKLASIESLQCRHGAFDEVLHQMTRMILPSLTKELVPSELFLDYFRLLFCAHITQRYSPSPVSIRTYRGGLAAWQKRRVIEILRENLDGQVGLANLAWECGLSVSHFTRLFRKSFGTSAHRYLTLLRIEAAKSLLSNSASDLSVVALRAGFSDQASFTRSFKAAVGLPPGQWRREACSHRTLIQ
jgi:AraC family transcriptional regulator